MEMQSRTIYIDIFKPHAPVKQSNKRFTGQAKALRFFSFTSMGTREKL